MPLLRNNNQGILITRSYLFAKPKRCFYRGQPKTRCDWAMLGPPPFCWHGDLLRYRPPSYKGHEPESKMQLCS